MECGFDNGTFWILTGMGLDRNMDIGAGWKWICN